MTKISPNYNIKKDKIDKPDTKNITQNVIPTTPNEKRTKETTPIDRFKIEREFAERTSMHGYGTLIIANSPVRRLLWAFICLIGLAICLYFISKQVFEFVADKPIISKSSKKFFEQLHLPKMMICNPAQLRSNLVNENPEYKKIIRYLDVPIPIINEETTRDHEKFSLCLERNNISPDEMANVASLKTSLSVCVKSIEQFFEIIVILSSHNGTDLIEDAIKNCIVNSLEFKWPYQFVYDKIINITSLVIMDVNICIEELRNKKAQEIDGDVRTYNDFYRYYLSILEVIAYNYVKLKFDNGIGKDIRLDEILSSLSYDIQKNILHCMFNFEECEEKIIVRNVSTEVDHCQEIEMTQPQMIQGKHGGISLIINLEAYNSFVGNQLIEEDALNVMFHDDLESPISKISSVPIQPGYITTIALKKLKTKLLDLKDGGDCSSGIKLSLYKKFSTAACLSNCALDQAILFCNCTLYTDRRTEKFRKCSTSDEIFCSTKAITQSLTKEQMMKTSCVHCSDLPCESVDYGIETTLSEIKIDSMFYFIVEKEIECLESMNISVTTPFDKKMYQPPDILKELSDICLTRYNWKKNLIKLNVYYKGLMVEETEQLPKFTLADFIGSIGGTMGIYTGMSLLSIVELIDYGMLRIFRRYQ
ncbi:hypothetical protein SNEBB_005575 [Seison nebaliae]|nr:hypothetical protein SNEBB_005575 [Seison nebaliae]